ncbi:MAG: type II secretion system GspH family protein [Gemmatimonadetes bacterium]|nr:type II secretion system GspH family protein [Gemmatimonadota bacterium]
MTTFERDGFTVVEVLIAVAIASVLSGVLMATISGQNRLQAEQDALALIEETTRALADGLVPEVRAAGPGDIVRAESDRIVVRSDLSRAIVCEALPSGEIDLYIYDAVEAANLPRGFRGTAISEPYEASFIYADGFTPTMSPSREAAANCRGNGADAPMIAPNSAFQRTSGWSTGFATPPGRGSVVRMYGTLTYELRDAADGSGNLTVRRNTQEFATFLAPDARFEYVMANGTTATDVRPPNLRDVRDVRLTATALGRVSGVPGRSVVHEVPLRN